ncbi:DEAD/DEAH box helicase [Candidatus Nitrospira bockiana]
MRHPLQPWTSRLRQWQKSAFEQMERHGGEDFLAMATPGAGKTRFALRVAHDLLFRKAAARVVVVCPTNHLRQQWAKAAAHVGLQLDPYLSNEQARESSDYHGCVVSYHQVCLNPRVFHLACRGAPTMAIFDELHHAGDGKDWGDALHEAFHQAVKRLSLSGTPFRSDNSRIPFVRYVNDQSMPDYRYGYQQALSDRVCRPIVFPTYEGELSWVSNGREMTARFEDALSRRRQQERLRTALLHDEWLNEVIKDADRELLKLRAKDHSDAAGLIVAMDQDHARHIAGQVKTVTGASARLAVSDDPDSSRVIERFSTSRDRWLVAVNMVSEGVDIPRLRVGVYASNVQTEMYFRQVVGRFVRMQPELPASQRAYLYLPRDPRLVEYAEAIKAERDHVLWDEPEPAARTLFDGRPASPGDGFLPLWGVAVAHGRIGEDEPAAEPTPPSPAGQATVARYEHKEQLRQIHKNLVGKVARQAGVEHRRINAELLKRTGSRIEHATLDELKRRIQHLERWLERGYDERR